MASLSWVASMPLLAFMPWYTIFFSAVSEEVKSRSPSSFALNVGWIGSRDLPGGLYTGRRLSSHVHRLPV